MKKKLTAALLCVGLGGWITLPAAAQAIYRCGNSYSERPCAGGKLVDADDARSASQKSQTDEAVRRDAKAAEALEKVRLKEEAIPAQMLLPLAKPQGSLKYMVTPTLKKPDQFTAVAPKKPGDAGKKKKKKTKKKEA